MEHRHRQGLSLARVTGMGILLSMLVVATLTWAKKPAPPSQADLDAITARGRLLAEYDVAAWHATDAVLATVPPDSLKGTGAHYLARKTDAGWVVAWAGSMSSMTSF